MRELGARLGSSELTDWIAYYRLYPFGAPAENRRFAESLCLLANCNRDSKKKTSPFTVEDFLPGMQRKREPARRQSIAEQKAIFEGLMGKATPSVSPPNLGEKSGPVLSEGATPPAD